MRRQRLPVLGLALLLLVSAGSRAATVTTPGIIAQTTAATFACMRWMPVGVCFWLRCSWTGCRVRTSLKVGHYNPARDTEYDPASPPTWGKPTCKEWWENGAQGLREKLINEADATSAGFSEPGRRGGADPGQRTAGRCRGPHGSQQRAALLVQQ